MTDRRPHIFGMTPRSLKAHCKQIDLPPFTAGQVLDWVYGKKTTDLDAMTNLAKAARAKLAETIDFETARLIERQEASDGTRKLLVEWPSPVATTAAPLAIVGNDPARQTECVLIPTGDNRTACISSQIGCPVGCRFCASGIGGLDGNLTTGQIVEQAWALGRLPDVERVTNVVFMGMGEPLANFAAVIDAIRTINASWGLGIGARRITVSTVGMPAAIRKLIDFDIPVTLALSLHAPNDELRRELIPWASYATIVELLDACREYFDRSGREITLEYILIGGVNDHSTHAHELAKLAKTLRSNVNLIRYNEVEGLPYVRPTTGDVRTFQEILRKKGVNAHIRKSRGRDIAAACGQLRHESGA
ncbi:MAG: dual-specificity RNA methyltransferase RlmN [Planctomycetota bacterium]|jgi:23S rRNA (adenine2503-C2)-methyltransferase